MIIMKASLASSLDLFRVGSNKTFTENGKFQLSPGIYAHHGFFSTVKIGMGNTLLNVSSATSAFYESLPVVGFCEKNGGQDSVTGLKVHVTYTNNKIRTIKGFGKVPSTQQFTYNNAQISVLDYLRSKELDERLLDVIGVSDYPCANTGTSDAPEWYPIEALAVVAHQNVKKLSPDATALMLSVASKKPKADLRNIVERGLQTLVVTAQTRQHSVLHSAGISVSEQPLKIPFHTATYQPIRYQNSTLVGHDHTKRWDLRNKQFYRTTNGLNNNIAVLVSHSTLNKIPLYGKWVADQMRAQLTNTGINVTSAPHTIIPVALGSEGLIAEFDTALKAAKSSGLVILVNDTGRNQIPVYNKFKRVADQMHGKHALCVTTAKCDTFYEKPGQYFANIATKVNIKLGNVNHTVRLNQATMPKLFDDLGRIDTIILGADATHAQKDSKDTARTLAALVESVDETFGQFGGSVRYQPRNQEVIEGLAVMTEQRLRAFRAVNKQRLPSKILYYRDGVDSGQYRTIREKELEAIRKGYRNAGGCNKDPEITAVIVTKRHHTRFYPTSGPDNCLQGTCVDSGVTHPNYFEFFLQSHISSLGTARPTHYFVLENGMKFTTTELQNLTNWLCFTYARATLPVGYVPAAYYADRLCERVRCYFHDFYDPDSEDLKDVAQGNFCDLNSAKKSTAWDIRFKANGSSETDVNGVRKEAPNSHSPWHKDLNDKFFWL